jgi:uncharacterized protein (DUF3084 family)
MNAASTDDAEAATVVGILTGCLGSMTSLSLVTLLDQGLLAIMVRKAKNL